MPNRLAAEHSPYLLQHEDNPVDWYPWGEEAFERARSEDKPIFLSIGYSTCHWCHVMEHESFESRQVADVLNRHFVPIKVDREERPDVDRVYMTFVQATTGSGGWPMSVWLTPSLQPFYGGTYFPPTSKWGRPGFIDILKEIARAGRRIAARDRDVGRSDHRAAARARTRRRRPDGAGAGALDEGVEQFAAASTRGAAVSATRRSFRGRASCCSCCASTRGRGDRRARATWCWSRCARWRSAGCATTSAAASIAIRSTANWRVPHFEKMLYDQAQLVLAYLEAAQASGDPFFAEVAEDTLAYVQRDMTDDGGRLLFRRGCRQRAARAGGAIRQAHKMEGAFYIWRDEEIAETARQTMRTSSASASASCPTATRRSIRRTNSSTRTCCTPRAASTR